MYILSTTQIDHNISWPLIEISFWKIVCSQQLTSLAAFISTFEDISLMLSSLDLARMLLHSSRASLDISISEMVCRLRMSIFWNIVLSKSSKRMLGRFQWQMQLLRVVRVGRITAALLAELESMHSWASLITLSMHFSPVLIWLMIHRYSEILSIFWLRAESIKPSAVAGSSKIWYLEFWLRQILTRFLKWCWTCGSLRQKMFISLGWQCSMRLSCSRQHPQVSMQMLCNFLMMMQMCDARLLHCGSSVISKSVTSNENMLFSFSSSSANFQYGTLQLMTSRMLRWRSRLMVFLFSDCDHSLLMFCAACLEAERGTMSLWVTLVVNMSAIIISQKQYQLSGKYCAIESILFIDQLFNSTSFCFLGLCLGLHFSSSLKWLRIYSIVYSGLWLSRLGVLVSFIFLAIMFLVYFQ